MLAPILTEFLQFAHLHLPYNDDHWDLYEESYRNINIIPYEDYSREYDYYEVYKDWKNKDRERKEKERLEENIKTYCSFSDPEDLYDEYEAYFDDYYDAEGFWDKYCK